MNRQTDQARAMAAEYADMLDGWPITLRPLFGAIALYRAGVVFAMVWEGGLYCKTDADTQADYDAAGSRPLIYQTKGEERALTSFREVPAEVLDDPETLLEWAERAFQAAIAGR
ncbi:MAG: TfoX/Sxy family protein [Paracoccus sp. (in: a-proteobacteria)]|uniref:TfoX/Sxy family protein n=1 Tax=Paracoccus sp. TaxID=267 RepID=UPI0026DEB842|nr:TfoX/Sxy family protein [Paracoccus sp. (in: a-proteobacteria)]MDO5620445.1 TfoX/Sxy family protein [Paracoccus sp. (in: a-proteobacteria)]